MISAGVDAIVINPSSPTALKPVAAQARARGIQVVFIDQYVSAPGVYNASNDQVAYGRLGAIWLFKKLAAGATSSRCAASPASRPTPTATRASSRR